MPNLSRASLLLAFTAFACLSLLEKALAVPEDAASAIAPENNHARAQAGALLARIDAVFK